LLSTAEEIVKIFDISVPVTPELPVWPGDPMIELGRHRSIAEGNTSNDSRLACSVHSGTHVDAPIHFIENASPVEQLPLDVLTGPAVVIDLPTANVITADTLESLSLPADTRRVLFKTRNSALWAAPDHRFNPDFVALNSEAARWIIEHNIRLVGIDYLSIQKFDEPEPLVHPILLKAEVVIVEGLDLRSVRPGAYQLICLPLKLAGCDGAPARAVLIEE
jgi:arylformamidase